MTKYTFIALLAFSTLAIPSVTFACPQDYVACGETNQLCCPG
jgi:hypothetical protein